MRHHYSHAVGSVHYSHLFVPCSSPTRSCNFIFVVRSLFRFFWRLTDSMMPVHTRTHKVGIAVAPLSLVPFLGLFLSMIKIRRQRSNTRGGIERTLSLRGPIAIFRGSGPHQHRSCSLAAVLDAAFFSSTQSTGAMESQPESENGVSVWQVLTNCRDSISAVSLFILRRLSSNVCADCLLPCTQGH